MLKYLLDTDISIYVMKNKPLSVRAQFSRHDGNIAISSVSMMELYYGCYHSEQQDRNLETLDGFRKRLSVLEFDLRAAEHAGDIRANLRQTGQMIGAYDLMIAGHARSLGLILVTNNSREFERMEGLRLENWADD